MNLREAISTLGVLRVELKIFGDIRDDLVLIRRVAGEVDAAQRLPDGADPFRVFTRNGAKSKKELSFRPKGEIFFISLVFVRNDRPLACHFAPLRENVPS